MNKFIDFSEFTVDGEKVYNNNTECSLRAEKASYGDNKFKVITNNNANGLIENTVGYNEKVMINGSLGPLGAVLGIINNVVGSVENIIVSCNVVRVEKEKTKQVRIQADAFIAQAKEETKRIAVHEREETKRVKAQLIYDYKKFRASLFKVAKEIELKNNELIESGRKFDIKMDVIKEHVKVLMDDIISKNNIIIKQWQQGESVDENILMHVENLQNQSNQLMIELMRI